MKKNTLLLLLALVCSCAQVSHRTPEEQRAQEAFEQALRDRPPECLLRYPWVRDHDPQVLAPILLSYYQKNPDRVNSSVLSVLSGFEQPGRTELYLDFIMGHVARELPAEGYAIDCFLYDLCLPYGKKAVPGLRDLHKNGSAQVREAIERVIEALEAKNETSNGKQGAESDSSP